MKIVDVRIYPLSGGTVDGGWPQGHEPQEDLHTLVEVVTDWRPDGMGKLFHVRTARRRRDAAFVAADGRGFGHRAGADNGDVCGNRLSGRDAAERSNTRSAASTCAVGYLWERRAASRFRGSWAESIASQIKPYGSILFDEPDVLAGRLEETVERGVSRDQVGLAPVRPPQPPVRRVARAHGPRNGRRAGRIDGRRGGSEQFWPHGVNWARETARMLANYGIIWFEEPLPPDDLDGYIELTRDSPVPIAGGEVLDAAAVVSAVDRAASRRHHSARLHEERRT